jgi:hypothetical protein
MSLVAVFYEGPFAAEVPLPGGGFKTLLPGDEHEVTEEDLKSTHWRRKPKASKPHKGKEGDS